MNNNVGLTQCDKMLWFMYNNRGEKKVWYGRDFQHEPYFIGYEASARMSDLIRMYPGAFIVGRDGRFRTIELNEDELDYIEKLLEIKRGDR